MDKAVPEIVISRDINESFYSVRRLTDSVSAVPHILESVRLRGDEAVREAAAKYDKANPACLEVGKDSLLRAEAKLREETPELFHALCLSRDLAYTFAQKQRESFTDFSVQLSPGLVTGQRTIPVERAGVYVPAGRFPLFSSVIMGSMPAKAAGVDEIILCTPPVSAQEPYTDERILAVASLCGIDRVFAIGGAQAIAAMAYGTQTVPRVNVVVGPGNKFVAAAKKLVFGEVGIDMLAGPSEVMVIADSSARADWVAADLYAQAEHDPDAQAVLVTDDMAFAKTVQAEIGRLLDSVDESRVARQSLENNGLIIVCESLGESIGIANRKAPEHLELSLKSGLLRDTIAKRVRNFGSLFVGHGTAEVLGDYAAGLNHTLPTSGSASFTGGLSVRHFLKTVTVLEAGDASSCEGVNASLRAAEVLAKAEGLHGHALAAKVRLR